MEPEAPKRAGSATSDPLRSIPEPYASMLDELGMVVWELDVETHRVVQVSASAERILGFSVPAWLDGRVSWESRLHPEDRDLVTRPIDERHASAATYVRFLNADGDTVWLRTVMRAGTGENGRPVTRGITLDVTNHRRNALELERTLSMLTATLESTNDGILVVDRDDQVTGYNRRFVDMWHIPEDALRAGEDRRLIACVLDQLSDPSGFLDRVHVLYASPESSSFDTLEFLDGRVYERYSQPQRVEGNVVGRVWSFRDVTERRRAEARLRDSEARLREAQKLEAVGRLAGGVAHDFNNILTAVLGNAGLIAADKSAPARLREQARDIEQAASRAALLTGQLLAFSRRQRLEMRVVDLNVVLADMDKLLRVTMGERVDLVVRPAAHPCPVCIDRGQIEQVILNLVLNGRDAMPQGGRLEIVIDDSEGDAMVPDPPGPFVQLVVRDGGQGMDGPTRARIFEPFFTTKPRGKGTGLGLSTVYGIVQQTHGVIDVESEPGVGTTFRIRLPRAQAEAESTPSGPAPLAAVKGTETILVVEDERLVRGLVSETLRAAGHTVLEASAGDEAIRIAAGHPEGIHLLLTDVVMPGLTGVELAAHLLRQRPGLRVLFVSGFAEDIDATKLVECSGAFLQKPFTMDALLAKVRATLAAEV